MKPSTAQAISSRITLSIPVLLALMLLQLLYPLQVSAKAYKILLKDGREISCAHYYEKDGQIVVVRSIGEIGYDKDEVVEIREDFEAIAAPPAAPSIPRSSGSKPAVRNSTSRCYITDLWFRAELRNAGSAKLDELIAREQAKIAELENQLPALTATEEERKAEHRRAQEARREANRNAPPQGRREITGEDVIAAGQMASGTATSIQGGMHGELTFADPTPAKRKMMEQELSQHRCNLSWAEAKRSGASSP
jgi:hypothetical protein